METSFKRLTYSEVMSGKAGTLKLGPNVTVIQFVDSETPDIPWEIKRIRFRTIGERDVKIPPQLPNGFKFTARPEWRELRQEILSTANTGGGSWRFRQLDKVHLDFYAFDKALGADYFGDGDSVFDDRQYSDWFSSFDDEWDELEDSIEQLMKFALPHIPCHCSTKLIEEWQAENGYPARDPLPNRFYPPDLRNALAMMLEALPEFRKQRQGPNSN